MLIDKRTIRIIAGEFRGQEYEQTNRSDFDGPFSLNITRQGFPTAQ